MQRFSYLLFLLGLQIIGNSTGLAQSPCKLLDTSRDSVYVGSVKNVKELESLPGSEVDSVYRL